MVTGNHIRTGRDRGRDVVRTFNKRVLNPVMLRLAGKRYWYAAVLRHTGRRSGKRYATPVVVERTANGFIIPLPYGTRVDWLRNMLATGGATIETKGESHEVMAPTVIDADAALPQLSRSRARAWRFFGIRNYVQVRDRVARS